MFTVHPQVKPSLPPLSHIVTTSLPFQQQQQQTQQQPHHHQHQPQAQPHQHQQQQFQHQYQQTQSLSPIAPNQQHFVKAEDGVHFVHISQQRLNSSSLSPVDATPDSGVSSPTYLSKPSVDKCTCKHEGNHIPRPRNAFILFRQQHHQSVLDEGNVVKTNPDVSRELGKRWRDLSPPEKDYWNKLAEEEKKRHAEKYPGYRYIPRRFGKKGSCPFCKSKALAKQQQNQHQLQIQQQHRQQRQQALATSGLNQQHIPSSSATPEESKHYSSSSSEEHAIAQSFLNLRNQPQHYHPQQYYPYSQSFPVPVTPSTHHVQHQAHEIQQQQQKPQQQQPPQQQQNFYFGSKTQLPSLAQLDVNRNVSDMPKLSIPPINSASSSASVSTTSSVSAATESTTPPTPSSTLQQTNSKSCSIAHFLN